jgi:hypothetical protein
MLVIHTDLLGFQLTEPQTASVFSASRIRTLRNDPSDLRKASSTGSRVANLGPDANAMAHLRLEVIRSFLRFTLYNSLVI